MPSRESCVLRAMAEQREPVKRRMGLKIIKVGMDTRQVIARLEVERQALAMMDHRPTHRCGSQRKNGGDFDGRTIESAG